MNIEEKISMLRQMRFVAAQKATGGRNDLATTEMIRAHQAIKAFEAVISEGIPDQNLNVDVDGHPIDPNHAWNVPGGRSEAQRAEDDAKIRASRRNPGSVV